MSPLRSLLCPHGCMYVLFCPWPSEFFFRLRDVPCPGCVPAGIWRERRPASATSLTKTFFDDVASEPTHIIATQQLEHAVHDRGCSREGEVRVPGGAPASGLPRGIASRPSRALWESTVPLTLALLSATHVCPSFTIPWAHCRPPEESVAQAHSPACSETPAGNRHLPTLRHIHTLLLLSAHPHS